MVNILPTRFRYPLFFIGLLAMESAGFLWKYLGLPVAYAQAAVVVGFAVFVASVAVP